MFTWLCPSWPRPQLFPQDGHGPSVPGVGAICSSIEGTEDSSTVGEGFLGSIHYIVLFHGDRKLVYKSF